jgi:hypothetical protein
MQVARLSAERGNTTPTQRVASGTASISETEHMLESWNHVPAATAIRDEESMHEDQDIMHCAEAWRNGLHLYIYRVFRWKPGTCIPIRVLCHARAAVDHVLSCRNGNMVARQALLPLFFAGCELSDQSTRKKILELCSEWDNRTHYRMFGSAIPLLEAIWAEQESKGSENAWWGDVVDRQHVSSSGNSLQARICFG